MASPFDEANAAASAGQAGRSSPEVSPKEPLPDTLQERIFHLLDYIPDGFVALDSAWRFLYVNRAAERLVQKPRSELIGRCMWELLPELTNTTFHREYCRAMAEQLTVAFEEFYAPQSKWFEVHAYPHKGGLSIFFRDTTQRRWAEAALREGEEKFRTVAETTASAMFIHQGALCLYVNPAAEVMTGYTRDELLAMSFWDIVHPDYKAAVRERGLLRTQQALDPARYEFKILTKQGEERWVDLAVGTIQYKGSPAIMGTAYDITERRRAEEDRAQLLQEARAANRHKDEFLATLAHELRNPLAPIRNALAVLRMLGFDNPALARARDIIDRQVHHMVRIIDDLLDVSRIEHGKIALHPEMLNLVPVIHQAVESCSHLITARSHKLTVSLPSDPLILQGDPTRIEQILCNLLTNAAKYTPSGGHIRLAVESQDQEIIIRVQDNGIGIAPEMLPRIFELFTQASPSLDYPHGGLGIGLTLVRYLAQLHGGRVAAFSAGLGKGSEFVVRLPAQKPAPLLPPPRNDFINPARGPARRILIIEDHGDSRETLQILLQLWGHSVEAAETGSEGLAKAAHTTPDIALIDVGLPGMNGYEVAQRLRHLLGNRSFLVALTGYGQSEDVQRALNAGFHMHLVKPVHADTLSAILAGLPARADSSGAS